MTEITCVTFALARGLWRTGDVPEGRPARPWPRLALLRNLVASLEITERGVA